MIDSNSDGTGPEDCEFCRIVRGQESADVLFETDSALAFTPLEPAVRGHTLVIPKKHVSDYLHADRNLLSEVLTTVQLVSAGIERALAPEGFNLISSAGQAASQTVLHLHVHVVPRWNHDRMGDIWPPTTTYLEERQDQDASAIREAINELLPEIAD